MRPAEQLVQQDAGWRTMLSARRHTLHRAGRCTHPGVCRSYAHIRKPQRALTRSDIGGSTTLPACSLASLSATLRALTGLVRRFWRAAGSIGGHTH